MKRILPQFTLGSLLLVVLIVAMGIAWWLDHSRLERELVNMQTRLAASELLAKDREVIKRASGGYGYGGGVAATANQNPYSTPGEFIRALRDTRDYYAFQDGMVMFVNTNSADDALPLLIALFEDPDPEVRARSLLTVSYLVRHAETLVPAIIPLLNDQDLNVRWHAANALGTFGGKARSALRALQQIIETESSPISSYAAGMAYKIDPSIDFEPRLQEFLRQGNAETRWRAVEALGTIAQERALAKATENALLEAFRASENEASKRPIAQLLERIEQVPNPRNDKTRVFDQ